MDMESMQRMIKHLSNESVYIKRNIGEGTSNKRSYKPFFRRPIHPRSFEPPPTNLNLNLEGATMDNSFKYHQANH